MYFHNNLTRLGGEGAIIPPKIDFLDGVYFYKGLDMYMKDSNPNEKFWKIWEFCWKSAKIVEYLNFAIWNKVFSNFARSPQLNWAR